MGRILFALVSFAALGAVAYQLIAPKKNAPQEQSAPKQRLDNVREAAHRIEVNDQKHLDDVEKKANQAGQ